MRTATLEKTHLRRFIEGEPQAFCRAAFPWSLTDDETLVDCEACKAGLARNRAFQAALKAEEEEAKKILH